MTQDQPNNIETKKPRRSTAKADTKAPAKLTKKAESAHVAPENAAQNSTPPKRAPRTTKKATETASAESGNMARDLSTPAAEAKETKRPVRRTSKKSDAVASAEADAFASHASLAGTNVQDDHHAVAEATTSVLTSVDAPKTRRSTRKPAAKPEEKPVAAVTRTLKNEQSLPASDLTGVAGSSGSSGSSGSADKSEASKVADTNKTSKTRAPSRRKVGESEPVVAEPKANVASSPAIAANPPLALTMAAPLTPVISEAQSSPVAHPFPARTFAPVRAAAPADDDDGIVTHILPPLEDHDDADSRRKRPRRRSRRKRKNEMQPFQPETFADIYPSAGLSSVLPLNEPFIFGDDDDEFEDDGPQPALPNQPSLALPPASDDIDDEDLNALDEAVNGNRVDAFGNRTDASGESRFGKNRLGQGRGKRNRSDSRSDGRSDTRDNRRQPDAEVRPNLGGKPGKQGKFSAIAAKPSPMSAAVAPIVPATPALEMDDDIDVSDIVVPTGKRMLYVSVVPDEQVEVVITDNGLVTEYFVEMAHQAKIRGNIYKGVVNNVDTNLQAAFVNFGSGKNGFLQIDEIHPEYWLTHHDATKGPKYPPIQKVMKVGQEVLVQVVKEPAGTKGAFLTTWVSLAGRFLVLTPGQEQIGVSRKVEDPEERARLKELLAGIDPGEDMGVIIRTASEGASKTSIQKDLQYLKRLWKDIRKRVSTEKVPSLIHQEADLAFRAVRDYLSEDIIEIWVDDESTLGSIREMTSLLFPRRTDMVKLHQDPRQTLWERFNLLRQLEEVSSREVVLPSGGRLVFDQTEALMAIDINSGKTQGKSNFEAMVFRTNMEAAEAIARHLRLRDIGGQVVIDFIEMRDRNHSRDVEKALRSAMRLDRARHDVGRMSSFGLLELVRQRTGTSAISISSEPCPHCRGTGVRRNMEWQALQVLRDLQAKLVKNAAQNQTAKSRKYDTDAVKLPFLHEVDYELGLYLLNRKRDRLLELESRYCLKIEICLKS